MRLYRMEETESSRLLSAKIKMPLVRQNERKYGKDYFKAGQGHGRP